MLKFKGILMRQNGKKINQKIINSQNQSAAVLCTDNVQIFQFSTGTT
jgi:hypothetical protein